MTSTYNDIRAIIEGKVAEEMANPAPYPVAFQNVPFIENLFVPDGLRTTRGRPSHLEPVQRVQAAWTRNFLSGCGLT